MGPLGKILGKPRLDEKIERAIYSLSTQQARLDQIAHEVERAYKDTFDKCVKAQMEKDNARAALYATEAAQARKVAHTLLLSRMAIEQIMLRLQTLREFGNVVNIVDPVSKVVRALRDKLTYLAPGVSLELRSVEDTLNSMILESGAIVRFGEISATGEGEKILAEASAVAEAKLKEKFPALPTVTGLPTEEKK